MTAFPTASLRNCPPDTQKKFLRCKTRHGSVIDVLTEIQAHNNSTTPCHPIEKKKRKENSQRLEPEKKKKTTTIDLGVFDIYDLSIVRATYCYCHRFFFFPF